MPFIVGASRSGSMLLGVMLGSHPALAISPKGGFITPLAALCGAAQDPAEAFLAALTDPKVHTVWPEWGIDAQTLRRELVAIQPFDLTAALRTLYRCLAQVSGKARAGDRTPRNLRQMALIATLLPEAHFIHLIRDGRAQYLSARRAGWGAKNAGTGALNWHAQVTTGRQQGALLPHYLELRYESLVADPLSSLKQLGDFLALPFDPAMLDYGHHAARLLAERQDSTGYSVEQRRHLHRNALQPPMPERISAWRDEMDAEEIAAFENVAGDLLQELGYALLSDVVLEDCAGHRERLLARRQGAAGAASARAGVIRSFPG
jgi:hypothetical protein